MQPSESSIQMASTMLQLTNVGVMEFRYTNNSCASVGGQLHHSIQDQQPPSKFFDIFTY
jgi:hypothetical protein